MEIVGQVVPPPKRLDNSDDSVVLLGPAQDGPVRLEPAIQADCGLPRRSNGCFGCIVGSIIEMERDGQPKLPPAVMASQLLACTGELPTVVRATLHRFAGLGLATVVRRRTGRVGAPATIHIPTERGLQQFGAQKKNPDCRLSEEQICAASRLLVSTSYGVPKAEIEEHPLARVARWETAHPSIQNWMFHLVETRIPPERQEAAVASLGYLLERGLVDGITLQETDDISVAALAHLERFPDAVDQPTGRALVPGSRLFQLNPAERRALLHIAGIEPLVYGSALGLPQLHALLRLPASQNLSQYVRQYIFPKVGLLVNNKPTSRRANR